jgi:hypothetical protein
MPLSKCTKWSLEEKYRRAGSKRWVDSRKLCSTEMFVARVKETLRNQKRSKISHSLSLLFSKLDDQEYISRVS